MHYKLIRTLLFLLPPEIAHSVALKSLSALNRLGFLPLKSAENKVSILGLNFPSRIGIAAGLDKNGEYIDALAAVGFGFVEVGTVTPRPQPGNPKPRLFRLPKARAIINRLGFNNKGVDYLIAQVKKSQYRGVLGINIGKNFDTPLERAAEDYLLGLRKVYPFASYITVNISSPNTPGLRQLQLGEELKKLLSSLKAAQAELAVAHKKYVPLFVKIAPDLTAEEIQNIANILLQEKIDGVIATNTTLSREGVEGLEFAAENGGLSGKPVFEKSLAVVRQLHAILQDKVVIIGCGGIFSSEDVEKMLAAGASLVQVYTGFIYQGADICNL